MIDFELLKKADIEVVNTQLTPKDKREISKFLKAYKAKQARAKGNVPIRSRPATRTRKKV